ncbi:unnamed protein product [Clavelina lepadiformis]|uniref:B(0,+)-type amino acid transporter 1 n=1 Tax=Clavelina lepadiformis TaxID=159417 RepID=A0ABP0FYH0_CLALP
MSLRSRTAGSNTTEIELQPAADGALFSDDNRKDKAAFELKKKIGLPGSVALIAGTMVGSGIFASPVGVLVGTNNSVGMSLVLWAACGLIAGLAALCYCELGSAIRESGGEYAYLHKAYVPVITFTFAWTSCVISRNASNAATAVTFGSYVVEPFYPGCQPPDLVVKCAAAVMVLVLNCINYVSVKVATKVQSTLAIVKFIGMLIIIVGGMVRLGLGDKVGLYNLRNAFRPEDLAGLGFSQIGLAFYQGFWSYDGWNNLNYITEEVKNSEKTLPCAIMIAVPLVTIFYLLVNIAYFAVLTPAEMVASNAVAVTWGYRVLGSAGWIMPLTVCLSTLGAMNGSYLTGGRLPFVAARRGHLPQILGMANVVFYTPGPALVFTTILTLVFLIPNDFDTLVNAFSFTAWLFYGLVVAGVVVLRFTNPDMPRPFKVPILIPCIVVIIAIYLLVAPLVDSPDIIILYAAIFMMCGPIVYFIFVYKKLRIPGLDHLTLMLQQILDVAPTDWEETC